MLSRIFRAIAYLAIVLACLLQLAAANVEKEIFLGPPASTDPDVSLAGHLVPQLASSEHCSNCRAIRTRLNTSFVGKGVEHWVRVNGLEEGRRYEVRICWAATQPTDFTLDLFTPDQVLRDSALLEGILAYPQDGAVQEISGSKLYLRVLAKTAYVSSQKSRMENPEPVDVDIILDPYFLNVVPESLLKIIPIIVMVAVFAWWVGGWIHRALLDFAVKSAAAEKKHR
ncbi:hypothetical protein BZA05DRAFT_369420 [Tricharina praecox]|uniref:uncharacterized protein n=1 Tax=Tricharina praecox TaxID=43433 RepID=UPI00221FC807|nr:uncharacterized protein BZA05DRAFT_369420 [Tricharina praecox]KAI5855839.1 hypothetical protein BZA05DRAFT_369420 [Tricharina praecox]